MAVLLSAVTESAAEDKFIYKCISLGNTSAQLNMCKSITENTAKTREWLDQNWPSTRLQDWVSDQTFDWRLSVRDQQIDRVLCRWYTDGWLRIQTAVSLSSRHCCSFYTSKPELRLCFTSVCDYVFIMQDLQTKPDGLGNIFTLVEGLKKSGSKPFFFLVSKSWVVIQRTHLDPSIKPKLR